MLLDTSAWVEYFKQTDKGERIADIMENEKGENYTCALTLAEIAAWCHKNRAEPKGYVEKIKNISKVLDLQDDILVLSGKIYFEKRKENSKIGMIDAIIYTTARIHGLKLLTCDGDFRGLEYIEIV